MVCKNEENEMEKEWEIKIDDIDGKNEVEINKQSLSKVLAKKS